MLSSGCPQSHPYASLVNHAYSLLNRLWNIIIFHSFKEIVDWLTSYVQTLENGVHVFMTP